MKPQVRARHLAIWSRSRRKSRRTRELLPETVSGYTPDGEIVDWIYQQRRLEP